MCLPSSFPLSASQINVELGRNASDPFDMLGTQELALAGQAGAPNSMSNFLGKCQLGYNGVTAPLQISSSSHTFASQTLGPAISKTVFIGVHWEDTATVILNSATIAGNAANIRVQQGDFGGSTGMGAAIISATTSSATGDVVINWSSNVTGAVISSFYTTLPLNNITTKGTLGHFATNISDTINMPANGKMLLIGTGSTNTGDHTMTLSGVTQQYDENVYLGFQGVGVGRAGGGGTINQSANASYSYSLNMGTISNSGTVMAAMTWN